MKITGSKKEIISKLLDLEAGKIYVANISEPKSKRSIEQNKMLWKNLQLASQHMHQDLMKTYCDLLEEADIKSDFVITSQEMGEPLRKTFRGVQFIRMQEVNEKSCYVYKIFLGSSKMTVQECSELLERSFDLLERLGINYQNTYC